MQHTHLHQCLFLSILFVISCQDTPHHRHVNPERVDAGLGGELSGATRNSDGAFLDDMMQSTLDTSLPVHMNDDAFQLDAVLVDIEDAAHLDSEPQIDITVDAGSADPPAQSCPPIDVECDGIAPHDRNSVNRYPIVFIHGMGGFENLGPWDYFYGIPNLLRENGYSAYITVTDPFNTSEVRTEQLRPQIDRILSCTCRSKLNLIAHSQGGIDARLLISDRGYGDRIASLTTISTPHRGTRVADALLGLTDGPIDGLVDGFMDAFTGAVWGPPQEDPNLRAAMATCTRPAMEAFNAAHPNDEGVAYFSFAGFSGITANGRPECDDSELPIPRRGDVMAPEFLASFLFLGGSLTANDGLVPVSSAKWGRFRGCIPADHLDQIGQLGGVVDTFDYRRFYRQHAEFLADEGF